MTVGIYTDSGGHPGSIVGTLTSPVVTSSVPIDYTSISDGIALDANTTYWVVVSGDSVDLRMMVTAFDTGGTGVGYIDAPEQSTTGSGWYTSSNQVPMQILITP